MQKDATLYTYWSAPKILTHWTYTEKPSSIARVNVIATVIHTTHLRRNCKTEKLPSPDSVRAVFIEIGESVSPCGGFSRRWFPRPGSHSTTGNTSHCSLCWNPRCSQWPGDQKMLFKCNTGGPNFSSNFRARVVFPAPGQPMINIRFTYFSSRKLRSGGISISLDT